ncbi:MAG: YbaK/EbsC family protein [Candidatus Rokubacteria bacterium]|nr:YbaK/EbsC family protein [Candidatus Rokubacteria bacterium]
MALNDRLQRFLDQQGIAYQTLAHRQVFTAQEVAATTHVPGRQLAKVVVVRGDGGGYLMVVLPAACRIDLTALRTVTGKRKLSLAPEGEFGRLFPDCDVGAMPPFGNLYDMPVYIDACFPRAKEIFFQAGNHREVVQLSYADYARLVAPTVGEFCLHEREKTISE